MRSWLLISAAVALAACGGRVLDRSESDDSGANRAPGMAGGDEQNGGSAGSSSSFPSHRLGTCVPGFDPAQHPERSCKWLDEKGKCYDTKDDACACICPTDHDSICFSDFPEGTPPRHVSCV